MDEIFLIEPDLSYVDDIWEFRQEVLDSDADSEDRFAGCMSLDTSSSASEWIDICKRRKDKDTCKSTDAAVPSTMYLAVRKSDNRNHKAPLPGIQPWRIKPFIGFVIQL